MRRTKIIATVGPASKSPETIEALLLSGVNVLRINFSHVDASVKSLIQSVRTIAARLNHPLAVMADLQGPKLRIGRFEHGCIQLIEGQNFTLDCHNQNLMGNKQQVSVDYPELYNEVNVGDRLLLSDGLIELEVKAKQNQKINCLVIEGGTLSDMKGLNRKGGGLAARTITEKDKEDLKTAVAAGVDYICLSFVKDVDDIHYARQLIQETNNNPNVAIIAKIERNEALDHLTSIIQEADGIMVARGDLGVETGAAEVPAIQKKIINQTRQLDKVVITATQMMESMTHSPQPTRAEVSDVANAILDGTDAVMFSAETAIGEYPVKVIKMVDKVCVSAEKHAEYERLRLPDDRCYQRPDQAIAMAAMHTANHYPLQAIVALTESGATAVWMSRQQSAIPILAVTANPRTVSRLSLVSNVFPFFLDFRSFDRDKLNQEVIQYLISTKQLEKKGHVLITRGMVIGKSGGTNCLEILSVEDL